MQASDFCDISSVENLLSSGNFNKEQIGRKVSVYDGNPSEKSIVLLGVSDGRNTLGSEGSGKASDIIRKEFYDLYYYFSKVKIYDLGNLKAGAKPEDTAAALQMIMDELLKADVTLVIFGGGHYISYGQFKGYDNMERSINFVNIDARLDLYDEPELSSRSHLYKTLTYENGNLFNYTHLAHQNYLNSPKQFQVLEQLQFEAYRLGLVQSNISRIEPVLRDADMVAFDMASVRMSDAPAAFHASPNGLFGDECCQLMRYAGMSDRCSSVGLYEIDADLDRGNQTSRLAAQMIWHFVEGFSNRLNDYPNKNSRHYTKYITTFKQLDQEIIFYKSNRSDRWWMQVPYPKGTKNRPFQMVSCTYDEYLKAVNEEIPDRWLKVFNKLF